MTISLKDTDEIFFSVHFLMPLGIPFHEYMVSNRSIFFLFFSLSDTPCFDAFQFTLQISEAGCIFLSTAAGFPHYIILLQKFAQLCRVLLVLNFLKVSRDAKEVQLFNELLSTTFCRDNQTCAEIS